jgi:hypothetical protein
VGKLHPQIERRSVDRPDNGDVRWCPRCHSRTFEFSTRYRVPLDTGRHIAVVGWVCDNPACKFFQFARRQDDPRLISAALRRASRQLRVKARRELMKAHAVRQRAGRTLTKSRRKVS